MYDAAYEYEFMYSPHSHHGRGTSLSVANGATRSVPPHALHSLGVPPNRLLLTVPLHWVPAVLVRSCFAALVEQNSVRTAEICCRCRPCKRWSRLRMAWAGGFDQLPDLLLPDGRSIAVDGLPALLRRRCQKPSETGSTADQQEQIRQLIEATAQAMRNLDQRLQGRQRQQISGGVHGVAQPGPPRGDRTSHRARYRTQWEKLTGKQ